MVKVKCEYVNRKPIHDFLFDANSNVFPLCYHFQIFTAEIFMTLTFTMSKGQIQVFHSKAPKPMYNFPLKGTNNLHHICHRLRDNQLWPSKISHIPKFDLQEEDEVNDMTWSDSKLNYLEPGEKKTQIYLDPLFVWFSNEWYTHTFYLSPI